MSNVPQRSFGGGEIAPGWYARVDQLKYQTGLRTCRNFIIQKEGGASNRPGTDYIQPTKSSGKARLIKFVLNDDVAYTIEMGHRYARFYANGAPIVVSGVAAWIVTTEYVVGQLVNVAGSNYYCTTAHTSAAGDQPGVGANWPVYWYKLTGTTYEIPTPYSIDDIDDIAYVQAAETITIVHSLYPPQKLVRTSSTNWIISKYKFGPSIDAPTNVAATCAGAAGTTYYAVTAIRQGTSEESLPGLYTLAKVPSATNPASLTWNPVPNAISYNVYRSSDGKTYGLINSAGGITTTTTDNTWVDNNEVASGTDPENWTVAPGAVQNDLAVSATARAFDGNYVVTLTAELIAGGSKILSGAEGRMGMYYSRGGEVRVFVGYVYQTLAGSQTLQVTINVPDNGYTTLSIFLVPEVLADVNGDVSTFTLDASAGTITWQQSAVGFTDVNAASDLAVAPPSDPHLFDAVGDYPATAAYYQQRLFLGETNNNPLKVWGSQIATFNNFGISTPLQSTDAVSFALVGPKVNAIRHLVDLGKLLVMTAGGEMKIDGDDAGIIRPDAINPTKLSENGSKAQLPPIPIADSMAYVQARGNIVRGLEPVGAGGSIGGYRGTDLSVLASHLFRRYTIVDWDYAKTPHSVLWAVRSDGVLLGLTYLPEMQLWGWHQHDTDGFVEKVCCIPEGDEDRVYLIVRRVINNITVRYVERMASRYFTDITDAKFVDAGISFDGTNTSATTIAISGGATWSSTELLTATRSVAGFAAGDVGKFIVFNDTSGVVRFRITQYISTTVVKGFASKDVPVDLRNVATTGWCMAIQTVTGLGHLEGKSVAVFADGLVAASPNNFAFKTPTVVVGGSITLDAPYVKLLIGLPYISDLQTLDLDAASGPSVKDKKLLVSRVGLFVEESRGIWVGKPDTPTVSDPLAGLQEYKSRDSENWNSPNSLITDSIEVNIESTWDQNGRVFVRQVDPLPLTVLSITPIGYL